jgi:anaerobic selenocysteine-containing dehydrogenase
MNSMGQEWPGPGGARPANPLFMHPERIVALGLAEGQWVEVASAAGRITAPLSADATLRPDTVSLVHGFAGAADAAGNDDPAPGSVNRLVDMAEFDPISGIPRMSAIPVRVGPAPAIGGRQPLAERAAGPAGS